MADTAPNAFGGSPDRRTVTFRCAKTNAQFVVAFASRFADGKFAIVDAQANPVAVTGKQCETPEDSPDSAVFDAADFDFSGWYCRVCMHSGTDVFYQFVYCTRCGELVCGGRTYLGANGEVMFRCRDACGCHGGTRPGIESVAGASVEPEAAASSKGLAAP